ncbi:unannotated protein [freshwater metagenome]|uniref:uroporphyrinogen-III synthase n=1 Tax=freshwater metagenome TaxID=449393 RepID=A0A6J7CGY1_9ZZZZ
MTSPPLAGRRVVITRAADQSHELVQQIAALGAEAIVVPLIAIVEPSDAGAALHHALEHLAEFDWLVVTSPNGAARVAGAVARLEASTSGQAQRRMPRLAAVGRTTAEALPLRADLVPQRQFAAGLVAEFPEGTGTVLIAQAEQAGHEVADGLRSKGWQVEVVAAYRTIPQVPPAAERSAVLLSVLSADAVLFASGSAARAWVDVFGPSTPPVVIAIGPATAQAAEELGLKITAIAADHSLDGLVACLSACLLGHG